MHNHFPPNEQGAIAAYVLMGMQPASGRRCHGRFLVPHLGQVRTVRVAEQAALLISVPSFAVPQRVSARSPILRPILVSTIVPLPALVP